MASKPRRRKLDHPEATRFIESWKTMQQQIATLKSLTRDLEQEIGRTRDLQSRMWPKGRHEDRFASEIDPLPSKRKNKSARRK